MITLICLLLASCRSFMLLDVVVMFLFFSLFFFLLIRRPPSLNRPAPPFPTRRSSDLDAACKLIAHIGFLEEDACDPVQAVVGIIILQTQFLRERSEEHTSELQSLMRISYAVFCLKKKKQN